MALTVSTIWEVRSTGSNEYGGAFDPELHSFGVDYSQQDMPNLVIDNISVSGATVGATSGLKIWGRTVSSGDLGNVLSLISGTNIVAGRYQVLGVDLPNNQWLLDANCATGNSIVGSGNFGGCMYTLGAIADLLTAGQKAFVKHPAINSPNLAFRGTTLGTNSRRKYIVGYRTSRFDGGYCDINAPRSGILFFGYYVFNNFNVDAMDVTAGHTIQMNNAASRLSNIRISSTGWKANTTGIRITNANNTVQNIEVSGSTSAGITSTQNTTISNCYLHECNVGINIRFGSVESCYIINSTSHGCLLTDPFLTVTNMNDCMIVNSQGDGLRVSGGFLGYLKNNVFALNSGFGVNHISTDVVYDDESIDNNYFYQNASGLTNNFPTTTLGQHYTSYKSKTFLTNPFVDVSRNNFNFNTSPSGGNLAIFNRVWTPKPAETVDFDNAGPAGARAIVQRIGTNGGYR